jgi:hypothetical protein
MPGHLKVRVSCAVCGEQAAFAEQLPPGQYPADMEREIRELWEKVAREKRGGGCATGVSPRDPDREIRLATIELSASRLVSPNR